MWYRLEFNNLSTVQKQRIIGDDYMHHNNHNHNHDDDDDDDEDDDVIFRYPVIAQTDFVFWGLLSQRIRQSWKDRATDLNNRPVPGLLAEFPHVWLPGNLENMVTKALHSDFSLLSTTMHRSINREPRITRREESY